MTPIERIGADLSRVLSACRERGAYGVRRALAALLFNKAKRRGLAALHTLRDFGHGRRCFYHDYLQLRASPLAAIQYVQLQTELLARFIGEGRK